MTAVSGQESSNVFRKRPRCEIISRMNSAERRKEEDFTDEKRPDLRFHGAGFDAPVPAELNNRIRMRRSSPQRPSVGGSTSTCRRWLTLDSS